MNDAIDKSNAAPVNRWVNDRAAADYMGLAAGTLQNWRVANRGPRYSKLAGGAIRYSTADLDAFLASGLQETRESR